jgi:cell division transport system permease protein
MSMHETATAADAPDAAAESTTANVPLPTIEASLIPADSIAGRALIAVIAMMTLLAALMVGAVVLVRAAAGEWQSEIAREMTIQVRPGEGRDLDAEVDQAAKIAAAIPGIASVRPYSRAESARLLQPWLGTGISFDDLPVPRLIVVRTLPQSTPDLAGLRKMLAERVPGASLDDHRGWINSLRAMARTAIGLGIGALILVLAATMLAVTFATRGAMAANRAIIEVLHFVGATDGFIAGQFQRHFLVLGLKGGTIGGGSAMMLFALAGFLGDRLDTAGDNQINALFGSFTISIEGYGAVIGLIVLVATLTAATSGLTVYRTLGSLE